MYCFLSPRMNVNNILQYVSVYTIYILDLVNVIGIYLKLACTWRGTLFRACA
jgi:hypothetical protein